MKYRNNGVILPGYASKARLAEAGLLSAATGKAALVRLADPTVQDHDANVQDHGATVTAIQNHATSVTAVTYNNSLTLIMCRYLARPSSGEIRKFDSGGSQRRLTCLEGPQYQKSRGCAKCQPQIRPPCGQGTSTFRASRAVITAPKRMQLNYLTRPRAPFKVSLLPAAKLMY